MNWYKQSKLSEKPYRIFIIGGGKDEEIKELGYIMAKNANDARKEALNRRIKGNTVLLKNMVEFWFRSNMDKDIVARLDVDRMREIEEYQKNLRDTSIKQKKQKEKAAWYMDDRF